MTVAAVTYGSTPMSSRRITAEGASDGATDAEAWLAERRTRWVIGTPDEARARIELLAEAGVERLMLQDFLPRDLDLVADIGRIVAG